MLQWIRTMIAPFEPKESKSSHLSKKLLNRLITKQESTSMPSCNPKKLPCQVLHRLKRNFQDQIDLYKASLIWQSYQPSMIFSLLSTNTHFMFNKIEEEILDTTIAEQLQLEEALKASLFSSQMTGESSLSFCCEVCKERKSGKCGHSLSFNCSKLKKGNCPLVNCDYALKSDSFKQFQPEDLIFLWEKVPSTDPIPDYNCREESHGKMDSKNSREIIPTRKKYKKAMGNSAWNKKGPKQVYKRVKNMPSPPWEDEDERPAFAAAVDAYGMLKEKLQVAKKELEVMRHKVKEQHQKHMEEVECQEQFYKEQIRNILESTKDESRIKNQDKDKDNEKGTSMLANIVGGGSSGERMI